MRLPNSPFKRFALLAVVYVVLSSLVESMFLGPWLMAVTLIDGQSCRASDRARYGPEQKGLMNVA